MSKLLSAPVGTEKVVIGEYRADLEADREAEKRLGGIFKDLKIVTTTDGRKLVPIRELLRIERQMQNDRTEDRRLGFEDGYRKGVAEGHREAQETIENFAALARELVGRQTALYEEARSRILELVVKIARKITFEAARVDHEVTAAIIAGTIDKLVDKSHIKIKVHPDHLPLIEQQIDRFRGDSTAIKEIEIEADNRVRHGGCFIETPGGDIDARLESQMDIIAAELLESAKS